MNKRIKKIITSLSILMVVGCSSYAFWVHKKPDNFRLKQDSLIFELGDPIDFNISDFLEDTKNVSMTYDKEVIKELGTHKITFKKDNKEIIGYVVVKDTTYPEFINFKKELILTTSEKEIDLTKYFAVRDNSSLITKSILANKKIDFSKGGTYYLTVIATDISGNKTTNNTTLILKDNLDQKDETKPFHFISSDNTDNNLTSSEELKEKVLKDIQEDIKDTDTTIVQSSIQEDIFTEEDQELFRKMEDSGIEITDTVLQEIYDFNEKSRIDIEKQKEEYENMCEIPMKETVFTTYEDAEVYAKRTYSHYYIAELSTPKCNKKYFEATGVGTPDHPYRS